MVALLWFACSGLDIQTEALPTARMGEVYSAAVEVRRQRRETRFTHEGLPPGLTLHPELGVINGVPEVPGVFEVVVTTSRKARSETEAFALVVEPAEEGCGATWSGSFAEPFDLEEEETFDLGDTTRLVYLEIPVPPTAIDRVVFDVEGDVDLFVRRSFHPVDDRVVDHAARVAAGGFDVRESGAGFAFHLDLETVVNLEALQELRRPIGLYVAAAAPGPWRISTTCVPRPIVSDPATRLVSVEGVYSDNLNVLGDDSGVVFTKIEPFPDWLELGETGALWGAPDAPGRYPFTVEVTDETGATSVFSHQVNAYAPVPLECGASGPFSTTSTESLDPDSFVLFRVPVLDATGVRIVVETEEPTLPVDVPTATGFDLSSGSFEGQGAVDVSFTTDTWPPLWDVADPELRVLVGRGADRPASGVVRIDCETGPRPAIFGLPVLRPGVAATFVLDAAGEAPIGFDADGLPEGVTLTAAGQLDHDGTAAPGTTFVTLTLEDASGNVFVDTWPLFVGIEAACGDEGIVLGCGDTSSGRLDASFVDDPIDGLQRFCVPPWEHQTAGSSLVLRTTLDGAAEVGFHLPGQLEPSENLRADVGSPDEPVTFENPLFSSAVFATVRPIEAYDTLPLLLTVRAGEPLSWATCMECPFGTATCPLP
ncbi:MAG: putative Ig domain-containing protein [Myxococcota bacterium]